MRISDSCAAETTSVPSCAYIRPVLNPRPPSEFGLFIDDLFDPSPASKAGVQVGDFVVEINGIEIRSVVDFQQTLYYFSGVRVPVRFFRDGKEYLKLMTIERRPPEANRTQ